jgi:hypothetical protein
MNPWHWIIVVLRDVRTSTNETHFFENIVTGGAVVFWRASGFHTTTMSTVFISVGQCGNQVGSAFWQRAAALPCASNSFFDEYGKARAILVDAEPKVVTGTLAHIKAPLSSGVADSRQQDDRQYGIFRRANVCLEQSGRGNNWALGYFGPGAKEGSDESLSTRVLAALEKEVERCDMFTGCVLMHSTTGGTGSGLGSRLLEQLCDLYGSQFRLTNSVLPSLRAGDSTLQSYNSVLTLSCLQQCTDAVIYADNDALWAQASGVTLPRLARPIVYAPGQSPTEPTATRSLHSNLSTAASNSVQIEDINRDMASGLVNFFSPWSLSSYQSQIPVPGTKILLFSNMFFFFSSSLLGRHPASTFATAISSL